MKTMVIGYGSIGTRHARVLKELGCDVTVVSRREIGFDKRYKTIEEAVSAESPEYTVIANRTNEHKDAIKELSRAGFEGKVLVEKPLFMSGSELPRNGFNSIFVGYNLRFHPLMRRLKELLSSERVVSAHAYAGKYLPQWRPETDYTKSYSAVRAAGGGVLRDLSHEIDLLNWMVGPCRRLTASGGHLSHLGIDSDDVFSLIMEMDRAEVATVQMNYVDRIVHRLIIVNTDERTFKADLLTGKLYVDEREEEYQVDRDYTFAGEHMAVLKSPGEESAFLCREAEGIEVMKIIDAAEKASKEKVWVEI
ncbi:MAG: Gfo/Idh/MocA family oxidoreductase [Candidatus Omnitrophica bacterium]|nr:Gfo/Idh/MocA family oxidoreductase [Candidatus Omnitrophota bacterium]MBU1128590.1 Gfo/Idh/MocA family oxidoreductase [Candidatus Omnitrophota bacterium]MBU1784717.1 Gfo/Idh/MocA family oxidoreductase [Candidatus Omnitrophota bacterium]MBU1851560.1 Gfo/Idh/MocA family oxidoreductase [Candidatus Omnitrophota bacterium]